MTMNRMDELNRLGSGFLRIHTSTVVREVDDCTCDGGTVWGLPHEQHCGLEFVAYAADARDADSLVDELNYLERALVYALAEVERLRDDLRKEKDESEYWFRWAQHLSAPRLRKRVK